MNRLLTITVVIAALGTVVPQDEVAGRSEPEPTFTLDLADGLSLEHFAREYNRVTGRRVFFDPRRLGTKTITGIGDMTFKRSEAEKVFQSIFKMHDICIVPYGDPAMKFVLLQDIKTSQVLKENARFIAAPKIAEAALHPGEIISTVIALDNVPVDRAQRALNNIIQEHRAGFVQPIEESNSLLITNFAPTVHQMVRIAKTIDEQAGSEKAKKWRERAEQRRAARASKKK